MSSSRGRVVVTWPGFDPSDSSTGGSLHRFGLEVVLRPKLGERSPLEVAEVTRGAIGVIASTDPFTAEVLDQADRLRVIARVGVGVDSIDVPAATRRGIVVTTTPGANDDTVADHTMALMLAVTRRLVEHDARTRSGGWERVGDAVPWVLHGSTVGLVGFGRVGQAIARRLAGFDVELLVCDPAHDTLELGELVELDELLVRSQLVSLHTPLSEATRSFIGPRELELMRPDSILVNTARGGLIDEAALVYALEARRIRGAALDVFSEEPPLNSRLLTLGNIIVSPHVAGISDVSVRAMTRMATQSVLDVLAGRLPVGTVNESALVRTAPREPGLARPVRRR